MRPRRPQDPATVSLDVDPICLADPDANAPIATDWIWTGFLAAGELTLLTSQWKTGKTTLLSVLLARLKSGGTLLGKPVLPSPAIVISEEPVLLWRQRQHRLDFGRQPHLISQPFAAKPSVAQWEALIDRLLALHAQHGHRLVVIDTVGRLFPAGAETNPDCMQRALDVLHKLLDRRIAVWVLHHPRKGKTLTGQLARGNAALLGSTAISLELYPVKDARPADRRRLLLAYLRHEETPRQLLIEWTPDGIDYLLHAIPFDEDFLRGWRPLRFVLDDALTKLRRQDILDNWPPDYVTPSKVTSWRWLDRAVDEGLIQREGAGRCHSPYRYYLSEKIEQWLDDPLVFLDDPEMHARAMQRANDRERAKIS
jgi:hypothetical protein